MKATNKIAIQKILEQMEDFAGELETIRDSEESEAVDNAVDDMEMVLEDLRNAREEG